MTAFEYLLGLIGTAIVGVFFASLALVIGAWVGSINLIDWRGQE